MKKLVVILIVLPALAACSGKSKGAGDADAGDDAVDDAAELDVEDEDGVDDDALDVVDEEAVTLPVCEQLGLPEREFDPDGWGYGLYSVAQDFTVQTTEGPWTLSENWTGCDVYLFIQDEPRQAEDWPVPLWNRDVDVLIARAPRNVHFFFLSYEPTFETVTAALDALKTSVDATLSAYPEEDRLWWEGRFHYVTEQARRIPGWVGTVMVNPAWGAGLDRFQRIRYIGSYADYRRYDAGRGWFQPNISMAANEAIYYNFEAEREERLEAESATVIPVFEEVVMSDPGWAGTRFHADAALPDATVMAGFDTMELDLYMGCSGDGEYGTCPAWDYDVFAYLCDEGDPDTCDTWLGHWITTYHREGRWVHDVSGLLPLLASGGSRRIAFYTQQEYVVSLSIRLSNQGKAERPEDIFPLFSGGVFDAAYNDAYSPITVSIPAEARKVELATVISGHGGVDPGNCAEFCNTTHHFFVDGTENVLDFPQIGVQDDCMSKVNIGTVPNQYGTWWYGRSGWCPGLEVPLVMTDITSQVAAGSDAVFDYEAYYLGDPYPSSGARIRMRSWVVVSY
ncbi:MAG: hypothetical protein JRG91_02100 [Deltaproteobacteria bacterium]|nr:hypothetical protein [Deltaproteobacteria bacterium]